MPNLSHLILPPSADFAALEGVLQNLEGIALICEGQNLLGVVTDGDYRRAKQAGKVFKKAIDIATTEVITASKDISDENAIKMMNESKSFQLLHLPTLDEDGMLYDLKTLRELKYQNKLPARALIMAGGYGKRLGNLTKAIPKPMLKVDSKPILELIIDQFVKVGITEIAISTHFLPDVIKNYFKDGKEFGANIQYIDEDEPMGTGGALFALKPSENNTIIINGDILSNINLTSFVEAHLQSKADITVASKVYEMQVPYGVLKTGEDGFINDIEEKPSKKFFVNSGIYIFSPSVIEPSEKIKKIDMPDIVKNKMGKSKKIAAFVMHEDWLDVGQPRDFEQAEKHYQKIKS